MYSMDYSRNVMSTKKDYDDSLYMEKNWLIRKTPQNY